MRRVLVTGGAGFLGSTVVRRLAAASVEVTATDLSFRRDLPVRVEVVDLLDREGVYRVVEGCDSVVHCGNHPHAGRADAQTVYAENCAMNVNVFQAAIECGVQKIVFCSSIQVINGDRLRPKPGESIQPSMLQYLPLDSDTPVNARNPYSQSKVAGEMMLRDYVSTRGISCVALRLPWIIGDWRAPASVAKPSPSLPQQLDEAGAALNVEDAATLIQACLRADLPGYRVYLPSMKKAFWAPPLREFLETVFPNVSLRQPVEELEKQGGLVDLSRIRRETGWEPQWEA